MTTDKTLKHNFKHLTSPRLGHLYIRKFESAVKNFEVFVEEERLRQSMAIKSRFASFN